MPEYPPTIIVIHPREKRRKCTVAPLRGASEIVFWKFPKLGPQPLDGYVRLGLEGPPLSRADADCGLLLLDGTWRLAERMERAFAHVPVRSLPPLQTAFPRSSKVFVDPHGGLATIEALYAAYRLLGRDCRGLLDHYRWKDEFLRLNGFT